MLFFLCLFSRKSFDNFSQDAQIKLNKHNEIIENIKMSHENEILRLRNESSQHLNEIKNIYENVY